jgi:hypothetical protein
MSTEAIAAAMNRIADALEQLVLSGPADPYPARLAAVDEIADLPPVRSQAPTTAQAAAQSGCPVHNVPWKVVPAGVSKKTGNAYDAFRACPTAGCTQRPPR